MKSHIPIDNDKISVFCIKWKVKEFYLFGSILRDDFGPGSDVDVCVQFEQDAPWDLFHIVEMIEELQEIFGRKVDLLEADAIQKPLRREKVMNTRRLIYAA